MSVITISDAGSYIAITVDGNTSSYPYNSIFVRNVDNHRFSLYSDDGDILYADVSEVTAPVSATVNDLITNTAFMFQTAAAPPAPEAEEARDVLTDIRNFQNTYIRGELQKGAYTFRNYDDYIGLTLDNSEVKNFNWFGVGPVTTTPQILGPDFELVSMHDFFNTPPTAGQILDISSDSTDDNPAGIGAIVIYLEGLDENSNFIDESVVLNGTTVVNTVNLFTRVNRALVVVSGTNNTNVGNIRIVHPDVPAQYIAAIPAGEGFNKLGIFTSPADYLTYLMKQVIVSCDVACELNWYQRISGNNRIETITLYAQPGTNSFILSPPPGIPGVIDTMIVANTASGSGNVYVMVNGYFIKQSNVISGPDTSGTAPNPYPAVPQPWTIQY